MLAFWMVLLHWEAISRWCSWSVTLWGSTRGCSPAFHGSTCTRFGVWGLGFSPVTVHRHDQRILRPGQHSGGSYLLIHDWPAFRALDVQGITYPLLDPRLDSSTSS